MNSYIYRVTGSGVWGVMVCVRRGRNAQSSKLFMESNRIRDQGVWFRLLTPVRCFYGTVKSAAPKLFRLSIDFQDRNKSWKMGLSDANQVLISDLVSKAEKYFCCCCCF